MYFYIYILTSQSRAKWSYVGCSSNLAQRLKDHNYGKVKSTKGFRPLKLVYFEKYEIEIEAYNREKYLKTGIGREEKNKIISKCSGIV